MLQYRRWVTGDGWWYGRAMARVGGAPGKARGRLASAQWGVLALLFISIFINYVDRGNLSIAGPVLLKPAPTGLGLDKAQLGYLLSAFFWTYALCQLFGIVAALLDRFEVSWVYAVAFLAWSGATA